MVEGTEQIFRKQRCGDCQDGKGDAAGEQGGKPGHQFLGAWLFREVMSGIREQRRKAEEGGTVLGKVNKLFFEAENVTKQDPKGPSGNRPAPPSPPRHVLCLPLVCRNTLAS